MKEFVISFWPRKHDFFGPRCTPKNISELTAKWGNLANEVFTADEPANIRHLLDSAFNFFNYTHLDFQAPEKYNRIARAIGVHVSATAGDMFCIQYDDTVIWWLCEDIGWKEVFLV